LLIGKDSFLNAKENKRKTHKLSIDFRQSKSLFRLCGAKKKIFIFPIVNKTIENANFIDFKPVNCMWVIFYKP